jgi:hypothetical protein
VPWRTCGCAVRLRRGSRQEIVRDHREIRKCNRRGLRQAIHLEGAVRDLEDEQGAPRVGVVIVVVNARHDGDIGLGNVMPAHDER